MALALVRKTALTADSARALDLSTIKAHLKLSGTSEDALLTTYRDAVEDSVGGPDGWLGRSLLTDSFYLYLDDWPEGEYPDGDRIYLPLSPLTAVTAITYRHSDGTTSSTWSSTNYRVVTGEEPGFAGLNYTASWPTQTLDDNLPIRVEFVAGYASAVAVPAPIKAGMLLLVEDLYSNRGAQEIGSVTTLIAPNPAVKRLLEPYRVRF